MKAFLENNWLSIISIIIGVVVSYVFYRLQKKDAASASAERKKHATTELLDVVESYIINKQRLAEQVIENLIYASERDHTVALRPTCTAVSLLQDVALRLQRSRHLDIPQKSEYSEKIELLIREIREHRQPVRLDELNAEMAGKLAELESLLQPERRVEARVILSALAGMTERQRDLSLRNEESKERILAVTTALFGVTATLATLLIGSKVFETVAVPSTISLLGKFFPVMGAALALIVTLQFLMTVLRIKRRKNEASSNNAKTDG